MRYYLKIFSTLILGGLAASCASLSFQEQEYEGAKSKAEALVELIIYTEWEHPDRLAGAEDEMLALEEALLGLKASQLNEPSVLSHGEPLNLDTVDLSDARSVLSAVHIASYKQMPNLRSGWQSLISQYEELAPLNARIRKADLGSKGVFLRLKAGPFDSPTQANSVCKSLRAQGLWCAITDFSGDPL